jgi:hypothetical protein
MAVSSLTTLRILTETNFKRSGPNTEHYALW